MASIILKQPVQALKLKAPMLARLEELSELQILSGWSRLQIGEIILEAEENGSTLLDVDAHIRKKFGWSLSRFQNIVRAARVVRALDGGSDIYCKRPRRTALIKSDIVALPLAPYLRTPEDIKKNKAEILNVIGEASKLAKADGVELQAAKYVNAALKQSKALVAPPKRALLLKPMLDAAARSISKVIDALNAHTGKWDDEYNQPIAHIIEGADLLRQGTQKLSTLAETVKGTPKGEDGANKGEADPNIANGVKPNVVASKLAEKRAQMKAEK